jgi:hypothetical protein
MLVLTDSGNEAAVATYRAAGATDTSAQVMLTWRLDPRHPTFGEGRH